MELSEGSERIAQPAACPTAGNLRFCFQRSAEAQIHLSTVEPCDYFEGITYKITSLELNSAYSLNISDSEECFLKIVFPNGSFYRYFQVQICHMGVLERWAPGLLNSC